LKICIVGEMGYLGWNTALYLARKGHKVVGFDNFLRERLVREEGSESLTPIKGPEERIKVAKEVLGVDIGFEFGDCLDYDFLRYFLRKHKPEAIVHYGEIPSAPYSMKGAEEARLTQYNNVIGTLNILWAMREIVPNAHLVKLGTMGEFGTPNIDILDGGMLPVKLRGRKDTLPFPKQPGSFYHVTKPQDTINIQFACKVWGLKSTDLQQGPVFGVKTQETRKDYRLLSRFDYDGVWGTVINRYCVQAIAGLPLSPYGKGFQIRGFIYIEDTLRCVELSILNPPKQGEYRSFNQFFELWKVNDLAVKVKEVCEEKGIKVNIKNIENPRVEAEKHYYNPENKYLLELGVKPHKLADMLPVFIDDLLPFKHRIRPEVIEPKVKWR